MIVGGLRSRSLQIIVVSSVAGSVVARLIVGEGIIYAPSSDYRLQDPRQLLLYLGIGLVAAFLASLLIWGERFASRLSLAAVIRLKVRYFTDGVVLGSQAFVDEFFERQREYFGERRKSGGRKMKGGDWGELRVLRDLKDDVVTPPG